MSDFQNSSDRMLNEADEGLEDIGHDPPDDTSRQADLLFEQDE